MSFSLGFVALHVRTCTQNETNNKMAACVFGRWLNENEESGMAVTEIKALSGYSFDSEQFDVMNDEVVTVKRVEVTGDKMAIYFDEVRV